MLPPHSLLPGALPLFIYVLTLIPTLFLYRYMHAIGTPKRDASGTLISAGEDLYQPGLTEYCWDVIYVTWACQVGSPIFGERFWWLYAGVSTPFVSSMSRSGANLHVVSVDSAVRCLCYLHQVHPPNVGRWQSAGSSRGSYSTC